MQVRFSVRHTDLTPELKSYIEEKLDKLPHYFDRLQEVQVIIEQVKYSFQVELIVISDLFRIQAREQDKELRTTFVKALRVIEQKLKKEKEKIVKEKKHTRTTIRQQPE